MNWKNLFISLLALLFAVPSISEAQISKLDKRFGVKKKVATTSGVTKRNRVEKNVKKTVEDFNDRKVEQSTKTRSYSEKKQEELVIGLMGEAIKMPLCVLEEFAEINSQVKNKLSDVDWWEIIKAEFEIFGSCKNKKELKRKEKLIGKFKSLVQKICSNPDNINAFPRARFVNEVCKGVFYRKNLMYNKNKVLSINDSLVATKESGIYAKRSSTITFWDTRSCMPITSFCKLGDQMCLYEQRIDGRYLYQIEAPFCGAEGYENATLGWYSDDEYEYGLYHFNEYEYGLHHFTYLIDPVAQKFYSLPTDESYSGIEKTYYLKDYRNELEKVFDYDKIIGPTGGDAVAGMSLCNKYGDGGMAELGYDLSSLEKNADVYCNFNSLGESASFIYGNKELNINFSSLCSSFLSRDIMVDYDLKNAVLERINEEMDSLDWIKMGLVDPGWSLSNVVVSNCNKNTFVFDVACSQDPDYFANYGGGEPYWRMTGMCVSGEMYFFGYDKLGDPLHEYKSLLIKNLNEYNRKESESTPFLEGVGVRSMQLDIFPDSNKSEIVRESSGDIAVYEINEERNKLDRKAYWRLNRSLLCPGWMSHKQWFFKPEGDYKYEIIRLTESREEIKVGELFLDVNRGWALVMSDGNYAGSPGCEEMIGYGDGKNYIGMEALAPWRNRPASVLEAIGGNADDIAVLKETTRRWLKKKGFDMDNMPPEPHITEFPEVKVDMPQLYSDEREICFTIKASATVSAVNKILVRVDGIIVPQDWDKELIIEKGTSKQLTVKLPLAIGQNWIEIVPIDEKGIVGTPYRFRSIYKGNNSSDLYVVTLGVSDYDDNTLDLKYAAKDARDLANTFSQYTDVKVRTFTLSDKEVRDVGVLDKVKAFLKGATLDDKVVFYVAGHGMLDDKLDYYYAPATFDVERIKETGISMDALVDVLQGCKARKRLLLLDTCHSGFLGEEGEELLAMSRAQLPQGVRAVQNRGMKVKKTISGLKDVKQKKRYIEEMFHNDEKYRGLNIVAGASGAEYALESSEWANGVFTASIMQLIKGQGQEDINKDGKITISEFVTSLGNKVHYLTNGKQRPSLVAVENKHTECFFQSINALLMKQDWNGVLSRINDASKEDKKKALCEIAEFFQFGEPWRNQDDEIRKSEIRKRYAMFPPSEFWINLLSDKDMALSVIGYDCIIKLIENDKVRNHLLNIGVDLNTKDKLGKNIIMYLYEKPGSFHHNCIDLDHYLDIDYPGYYIDFGYLKKWGADFNIKDSSGNPLFIRYGLPKSMLKAGVNVNVKTKHGDTPLMLAALRGYPELVKDLILAGADVNVKNKSGKRAIELVQERIKELIDEGRLPKPGDENYKYNYDWPKWKKIIQLLEATERGGDNIRNGKFSTMKGGKQDRSDLDPMIRRLERLKCKEAISELYQKRLLTLLPMIRNGADVDIVLPETKGNTALHYSCGLGSLSITRWLLEHGANPNAKTNKGVVPMECVDDDNRTAIIQLLKKHGAR